MEELEFYIEEAKDHMEKSLHHLTHALAKIRAGRAMPSMLDGLMVEYYGNPTPINQVASVNTPDAKTLAIKPWEKSMIPKLKRPLSTATLGLNPAK
jgi:ribosome recycling factor